MAKRNPDWTRDELILALELYLRHRRMIGLPKAHPEVLALSRTLNALPIHHEKPDAEHFRNPAGVYLKLCNFLRWDPTYSGTGMSRGNQLEEVVWRDFADNPEGLAETASAIRAGVELARTEGILGGQEEGEDEAPEGRLLYRIHRARERNRALVERKKRSEIAKRGTLACEACGFCFAHQYPEIGEGFIECHHRTALSKLTPGQRTKLDDLALVCANCHRMLHVQKGRTVEELRLIILRSLGPARTKPD